VVDRVVDAHFHKSAIPSNIEKIYDWLQTDGWASLIAASGSLQLVHLDLFEEDVIRHAYIISYTRAVTDRERLRFARGQLNLLAKQRNRDNIGMRAVLGSLTSREGKTAFVGGCYLPPMSPISSEEDRKRIEWFGVFDSRDQFLQSLDEKNLLIITKTLRHDEELLISLSKRPYPSIRNTIPDIEID